MDKSKSVAISWYISTLDW